MKRIFIALFIAIIPLVWLIIPVLATDQPDSTPTISNLHVNNNLITSGDHLVYGEYDFPYETIPTDANASESYIIQLVNGSTVVGSITVYSYFDSGYNEGIFGLYFGSGEISSNTTYNIRITQSPAFFDTPQYWDTELPTSRWSSSDDQEDNQTELTINVIAAAQRLQTAHDGYTLIEDSAGGTVLSSPTGETYLRGAIYGIQAMAPSLFLVQVLEQSYDERTWTTDQFDVYTERYSASWVGTAENLTADQFDAGKSTIFGALFVLPISIGFIVVSSIVYRRIEAGLICSFLVATCGILMGWMSQALYATVLQILIIYIGYLWFFTRAS